MAKAIPMKADEMQILKCISMKLNDEVAAICTYQYHVTKVPGPDGKMKNDRAQSAYRWLTRIVKIEDIKKHMKWCLQDENRLSPWMWPDDPSWKGKIFTKDSTNYKCYEFLHLKLKKLLSWEDGQKALNGYKRADDAYNKNAAYVIDGYTASNGDTGISLADKDALLSHVGQNLWVLVSKASKKNEDEILNDTSI